LHAPRPGPIYARMLLDISFLDDSTRPPPIKLEGLTAAQRAPGLHLREVHDHLRDNMLTLGKLIERASAGKATADDIAAETADLAMVANYRRFGNLCGQHCNIVDAHLFPAIAAQGPGFKAIADRLQAEHVVVHELLVRLIDALNDLAAAPSRTRFDATLEVYHALERVLLSHLGYEEEAIGDAIGYYGIF
jgi:hypothetical protein